MTTLLTETTLTDRPKGTSFAGLVGVELRRLWWRRLTKVALFAAVVVTGVTIYTAYQATNPESLARALDVYQGEVANFPQMVADCERTQQEARDAGQVDTDFGCAQMRPPTLENFGVANPVPSAIFAGLVRTNGLFYAFLAFVLGASFIAAEFSTGSLGTWLTFQPRRIRVGVSKLAAAAGGGLLVGATGLGLAWLGSWMVGTLNRPDSDLQLPALTDLGEPLSHLVLRHVGLVMAAGVVGAALGFLARNTGAVVGVVIGYAVVVEGIVAQGLARGKLSPWLPATNLEGFLLRGTTYMAEQCTTGRCEYAMVPLSYTHSWVYLSVFGLVLSALAVLVFRRRDVS
jgi:ABC-2 type transport system permease protein